MRKTACIARPAISKILRRTSFGFRPKAVVVQTIRTCEPSLFSSPYFFQNEQGDCFTRVWMPSQGSHVRIVWTTTAFGRNPNDVLRRIFDIAGLAMHAVLRINY